MAEQVLKDCQIFFDGLNLTGYSNQVSVRASVDLLDRTVFGSSFRKRKAGLKSGDIPARGFWDCSSGVTSSGGLDFRVNTKVGGSTSVVSVTLDNTTRAKAYTMGAALANYEFGGAVGDLVGYAFAAQSMGGWGYGKMVRATTVSSSGVGVATRVAETSAAPSNRSMVYAALHIFRGTSKAGHNTSMSVQVASSSSFGDATTFLKFSNVSTGAAHGQWTTTKAPATTKVWYRMRWKGTTAAASVKARCIVALK